MACECCRYHGTEDAYRNETVVWLEKDGCLSIGALIPVIYCPNCGCRL